MAGQDFGSRIRDARIRLGLNQASLALKAGVSRNTVAGWETGHSRPDLGTVPALCRALEITPNDFFSAGGLQDEREERILRLFRSLGSADREAITWQLEALAEGRRRQKERPSLREVYAKEAKAKPAPRYVTLYQSDLGAAAGTGTLLGEEQGEMICLLADPVTERADEVITVSGESMEPTFRNGDRVLVQHTDRLRPGEIGIFLAGGEGYIKEYREDGLHSHNPDYETMRFDGEETVRCVGRVLGTLKEEQIPDREQMRAIEESREGERQENRHE